MTELQYWKVLDNVVRLEVGKGHLRWTLSDLSRSSGVGRTLIYYYFGKSKTEIVKVAVKVITDEFFGLSPERIQIWESGDVRAALKTSILKSREMMDRAPHARVFFVHWRHTPGEIRDHFVAVELRYLKKLKKAWPGLSDAAAEALFTVIYGMVVMPVLKEEALDLIIRKLA